MGPALALATASFATTLVLAGARPAATEVAAVFPPWWSAADTLNAAGAAGAIVRPGGAGNVIIVASLAPGLADRLHRAGAILILDPVVSGLCAQNGDAPDV